MEDMFSDLHPEGHQSSLASLEAKVEMVEPEVTMAEEVVIDKGQEGGGGALVEHVSPPIGSTQQAMQAKRDPRSSAVSWRIVLLLPRRRPITKRSPVPHVSQLRNLLSPHYYAKLVCQNCSTVDGIFRSRLVELRQPPSFRGTTPFARQHGGVLQQSLIC